MESDKRGPGRPRKAEPFDGPVVLTLSLKREKLEIELTEPTRRELDEYLSWVEERAPHLDPGDSLFTTFEYAITTLLRTDKKWRERLREIRGGKAKKDEPAPSPTGIAQQPASPDLRSEVVPSSAAARSHQPDTHTAEHPPKPIPGSSRPTSSVPSLPRPAPTQARPISEGD